MFEQARAIVKWSVCRFHPAEIVDPARLATPHRIRIIAHHEHLFDVAA